MEGVGLPPCDPGFHWDEAQQKCVPDVVVPPSGDVLWDSNTNGHWNNGNSRVITSAHQFDPDDPTTEVAAGSDRRFEVKGDGTALLSGARARIYTHVNNYNAEMEITYIPNSSLDNLSLRLRSRHESGEIQGQILPSNSHVGCLTTMRFAYPPPTTPSPSNFGP